MVRVVRPAGPTLLRTAVLLPPGEKPSLGPPGPCAFTGRGAQAAAQPQPPGRDPATEKHAEMVDFLREMGLEPFKAAFLRAGFDSMPAILHMETRDLKDLGVPPFSVLRVRRHIEELRRRQALTCAPDTDSISEADAVAAFLREAGLGQYTQAVIDGGFDDMETLVEIEDEDLKALGFPRGHALKLKKRLEAIPPEQRTPSQSGAGQAAAEARAPPGAAARVSKAQERARPAVEQSWQQVQAFGVPRAAELLCRHTFAVMPEAVQVFPTHVRLKYREWSADEKADESNVYRSPALRNLFSKILNIIGFAVVGLHDATQLVPMLTQLGARHAHYGVGEEHFEAMGKALNRTLREILLEAFTIDVESAWTMAYKFMVCVMLEAQRGFLALKEGMSTGRVAAAYDGDNESTRSRSSSSAMGNERGGYGEARKVAGFRG